MSGKPADQGNRTQTRGQRHGDAVELDGDLAQHADGYVDLIGRYRDLGNAHLFSSSPTESNKSARRSFSLDRHSNIWLECESNIWFEYQSSETVAQLLADCAGEPPRQIAAMKSLLARGRTA